MKKITSIILILTMIVTMTSVGAFAAKSDNSQNIDALLDMTQEEYAQWKADITSEDEISLSAASGYIRNDYIEAYINPQGAYTIGTTNGNPDIGTDNNKKLLYGHPGSSTTHTLIKINGSDYFFDENVNSIVFSENGKKCVATASINGVTVKQTLSIVYNAYTQREDIIEVRYDAINNSGSSKTIGGRIMMDTMLGSNDGAPFKVPGTGNVTREIEFIGDEIPQYWQAFDNLSSPNVVATGTFYNTPAQKPDKVQFAYWGGISRSPWNYVIDPYRSVTGDSAVAVYYNPYTVTNGGSRTFSTYYGLSMIEIDNNIVGEIAAGITAPSTMGINGGAATVMVHVENVSDYSAPVNNIEATINLPEALTTSDDVTQTIGYLPVGDSLPISWSIQPVAGAVSGNAECSVTIKYDQNDSSTAEVTLPFNVNLVVNTEGIILDKSNLMMLPGQETKLSAEVLPANATNQTVYWSSSNSNVAQVLEDGTVIAVEDGEAVITATTADGYFYAECLVNVSQYSAKISVGETSIVKHGDEVSVDIILNENSGFAAMGFEVEYDTNAMKLVGVEVNEEVGGTSTAGEDLSKIPYNIDWNSTNNIYFNGRLATLTFKMADDVQDGEYDIFLDFYKGRNRDYINGEDINYDENFNPVSFEYYSGKIVVENYLPGDINGDERVNLLDAITLMKYLAKWDVYVIQEALDVNGDGRVNNKDATHLLRFLAGWDVPLH